MTELRYQLEDLVKEYVVAISLNQHRKFINISSKLCQKLIEFYDSELDHDIQNEELSNNQLSQAELSKSVEIICNELRKKSHLASAYSDVLDFVCKHDLLCFGRLVKAIDDNKKPEVADGVDVDELSSIVKKSVFLLRNFNDDSIPDPQLPGLWIDRNQIEEISSIGFTVHRMQLQFRTSAHADDDEPVDLSSLIDRIRSYDNQEESSNKWSEFEQLLKADWFLDEFLDNTLATRFPMDRFTILISIWIIAELCKHNTCQQLINELVNQIYHEEVNTNNKEELLRLTQVGSFWLSNHKRFKTSISKQLNDDVIIEESLDEDEEDEDQGSIDSEVPGQDQLERERSANKSKNNTESYRIQLRKVIDRWLLYGNECFVCGHNPSATSSTILECLSTCSCLNCNQNLISQRLMSSVNFDDIKVVDLMSFKSSFSDPSFDCYLLSPSEWARNMLDLKKLIDNRQLEISSPTPSNEINGIMDNSDNFDRFRVNSLRRERSDDSQGEQEEPASEVDSESDNDDDYGSIRNQRESYGSVLKRFMRWREDTSSWSRGLLESSTSESLFMIKFLSKFHQRQSPMAPLLSSDILILEEKDSEETGLRIVKVCLLVEADWFRFGTLWICGARSSRSKLVLGCLRLFTSMELLRLPNSQAFENHMNIGEYFLCPHCNGLNVTKFTTLYERFLRDD